MERRNLELSSRNEGTRDKFQTNVIKFELDDILEHFINTINVINAQFIVADDLIANGKCTEGENIWRFQIVYLAGALDFYMHELTKYGLCQIFNENWDRTKKYGNLTVNMEFIEIALKSGEDIDWFLEYFNKFYERVTIISYESIKEQLNLLGLDIKEVARNAFYRIGEDEKPKDKLKRRLNGLFSRRNIIAHQTDRAHSDAEINSITKEIVKEFVEDIRKIVSAIDKEARTK